MPLCPSLPNHPRYCADQLQEILLTEDQIAARVAELGAQISRDYAGQSLVILGVLNGVVVFLADLLRHLDLPCKLDFVALSSYGDCHESTGEISLLKEPVLSVAGQCVLVVEDIVDSGRTLAWLVDRLTQQGARVKVCALLDKPSRRVAEVQLDYLGFEIPDHFVVGYGLDFAQSYRNLPYVAVLKPEIYREVCGQ
jgi:hypoxanthine phosphoribosyltransferase